MNFAFEAKVILGLESNCPDGYGAKIRLNWLPLPIGLRSKNSFRV